MKSLKMMTWPVLVLAIMAITAPVYGADPEESAVERPDVAAFIDSVAEKYQRPRAEIAALLGQAVSKPDIVAAISKPAERKPWYQYRPLFLIPERINAGVAWWQKHAALLERAQEVYGVPAEYIVAIVGVETLYGKHTGRYRVLDALYTLSFDYPPRQEFFRSELEHFLWLVDQESFDPVTTLGSYAGAMGLPQFMPSSFRQHAIDFDDDGKRDLWNTPADIIGSVANYFIAYGWQPGASVVTHVTLGDAALPELFTNDPTPRYTIEELLLAGVQFSTPPPTTVPLQGAPLILSEETSFAYWIGWQNFYVITRYNRSIHYAMAVHALAQEIKTRYETATDEKG